MQGPCAFEFVNEHQNDVFHGRQERAGDYLIEEMIMLIQFAPKRAAWYLEEALQIIRMLQPSARSCGYHLALAGGVLNTGSSSNDLDIIVLPLGHGLSKESTFIKYLTFTMHHKVNYSHAYPRTDNCDVHRFEYDGRYIDFFFYKDLS